MKLSIQLVQNLVDDIEWAVRPYVDEDDISSWINNLLLDYYGIWESDCLLNDDQAVNIVFSDDIFQAAKLTFQTSCRE